MRTIVFADPTNAARSVIAEALFNARAPSGWRAASGGTAPAKAVSAAAAAVLAEIALDVSGRRPRPLGEALVDEVQRVVWVAAEAGPPALAGVLCDVWPIHDPTGHGLDAFRAVRDELRRRIARLVAGFDRLR